MDMNKLLERIGSGPQTERIKELLMDAYMLGREDEKHEQALREDDGVF